MLLLLKACTVNPNWEQKLYRAKNKEKFNVLNWIVFRFRLRLCRPRRGTEQGVRNRREIQLTRFALPYDYTCFADGTSICIWNIYNRLMYTQYLYIRQIFHIQMKYRRLQSMYNHMVGRTSSVISPFYSLLPVSNRYGCAF